MRLITKRLLPIISLWISKYLALIWAQQRRTPTLTLRVHSIFMIYFFNLKVQPIPLSLITLETGSIGQTGKINLKIVDIVFGRHISSPFLKCPRSSSSHTTEPKTPERSSRALVVAAWQRTMAWANTRWWCFTFLYNLVGIQQKDAIFHSRPALFNMAF